MSLTLHLHPLASFCHKVLIALYETGVPFTPHLVDLGDPASRDEFKKLWPIGKFPVLHDAHRDRVIAESTTIIEHLALYYPGAVKLIPDDPTLALQVRASDRFYDLHVHDPMQKIVGDKLRPVEQRDVLGVQQARERLRTALQIAEQDIADKQWAVGESFSMADCAAAPALFYTNKIMPLAGEFPRLTAYLERLTTRPAYARALAEAQPYFAMFPG